MTNEDAVEFIEIEISRLWDTPQCRLYKEAFEMSIKALLEQKTGHWIHCYTNGFGRKICKCSKCNWAGDTTGYKYCPNCGAKMVESEE